MTLEALINGNICDGFKIKCFVEIFDIKAVTRILF